MKIKKRHNRYKKIVGPIIIHFVKKKFNIECEKFDIKPPFLVLANHTTDFDAFFVAQMFDCPVYFVMSDHITTIPIAGPLIRFMVSPLPITKSSIDIGAVREVISAVKQGGAVGIFPEGNKSFAGEMSWIKPSTAKLVKKLNIPLVLVNIVGGYFSSPRWTKNKRKGTIKSFVNKVVLPDQIQKMTLEQIENEIKNGLRVNAYEKQAENKIKFAGENLAEGIETMLYACPECGAISALESNGNNFSCKVCHKTWSINEFGYVEGGNFDQLDKWDEWQKQHLREMNLDLRPENVVLTEDFGWSVAKKQTKYKSKKLGSFKLELFPKKLVMQKTSKKDALVGEKIEIVLDEIAGMAIEGVNGIQLWLKNGDVFRLKNQGKASALKYVNFIWAIKKQNFKF